MTQQQIELLVSIQRLILVCRDQTGCRAYHEVQAWPEGHEWSTVAILGGDGRRMLDSIVDARGDGQEGAVIGTLASLTEQRDALVEFIATHRKAEAA